MFIGPCIIAIVDEWKTNLMSLVNLFHLLCAQHVSDINISIFRSLRLCWWITTSVVFFSVRCVLELLLRLVFGGVRFAGWSTTSCASVFHSSTIRNLRSRWIQWLILLNILDVQICFEIIRRYCNPYSRLWTIIFRTLSCLRNLIKENLTFM